MDGLPSILAIAVKNVFYPTFLNEPLILDSQSASIIHHTRSRLNSHSHRVNSMARLNYLLIFFLTVSSGNGIFAYEDAPPKEINQFLKTNCLDCHSGSKAEAGFDLSSTSKNTFEDWTRVYDRVASGEMPPPDDSEIDQNKRHNFLTATQNWITREQQRLYRDLGRSRGKRLTRIQLENSLHDLLGIDIPLAELIPEEPLSHGFTTVGEGQPISHHQLKQHVAVIDAALEEAFNRAKPNYNPTWKHEFEAKQIARRNPLRRCREPEMRKGLATTWSSSLVFYGRLPVTTALSAGWYRMKIRAKSVRPPANGNIWCSIRTGECQSSAPLMTWVDSFEVTPEISEKTVIAWLPEGHMFEVKPADAKLRKAKFAGGQVGAGEGEPQNVPGIGIESLVLERIYTGKSQSQIRETLFGSYLETKTSDKRTLEFDLKEAKILIQRFADAAFRCPSSPELVARYFTPVSEALKNGQSFEKSIRMGYRAILCSPRFLLFPHPAGKLNSYALASRLSYFLWNRMPDEELLQLASEGRLDDKSILHQQVDRLLNHPHGQQFAASFAAEWLDLRLIGFTQPDSKLYPGFDSIVEHSMLAETHAFLNHLIQKNRSIGELIDSDYTFLNSHLASFYGINHVSGGDMQKVSLDSQDHRGGIITHGSVLKVTANGTQTSPVIRGTWIADRILGTEVPPPPANIPAIEPDTRGASTIREQLRKHQSDPSCASCHRIIDPPGFALENYDPSGRWRDYYTIRVGRKNKRGPRIDASATMPSGKAFQGISSFKQILSTQKHLIAKNVAAKLLTYATGAPVAFADRPSILTCVAETEKDDFGFRSLIHAVVDTPEFLNK